MVFPGQEQHNIGKRAADDLSQFGIVAVNRDGVYTGTGFDSIEQFISNFDNKVIRQEGNRVFFEGTPVVKSTDFLEELQRKADNAQFAHIPVPGDLKFYAGIHTDTDPSDRAIGRSYFVPNEKTMKSMCSGSAGCTMELVRGDNATDANWFFYFSVSEPDTVTEDSEALSASSELSTDATALEVKMTFDLYQNSYAIQENFENAAKQQGIDLEGEALSDAEGMRKIDQIIKNEGFKFYRFDGQPAALFEDYSVSLTIESDEDLFQFETVVQIKRHSEVFAGIKLSSEKHQLAFNINFDERPDLQPQLTSNPNSSKPAVQEVPTLGFDQLPGFENATTTVSEIPVTPAVSKPTTSMAFPVYKSSNEVDTGSETAVFDIVPGITSRPLTDADRREMKQQEERLQNLIDFILAFMKKDNN